MLSDPPVDMLSTLTLHVWLSCRLWSLLRKPRELASPRQKSSCSKCTETAASRTSSGHFLHALNFLKLQQDLECLGESPQRFRDFCKAGWERRPRLGPKEQPSLGDQEAAADPGAVPPDSSRTFQKYEKGRG